MAFGRALSGQGGVKFEAEPVGDDLGIAAAFVVAAMDQHDLAHFQAAGGGLRLRVAIGEAVHRLGVGAREKHHFDNAGAVVPVFEAEHRHHVAIAGGDLAQVGHLAGDAHRFRLGQGRALQLGDLLQIQSFEQMPMPVDRASAEVEAQQLLFPSEQFTSA